MVGQIANGISELKHLQLLTLGLGYYLDFIISLYFNSNTIVNDSSVIEIAKALSGHNQLHSFKLILGFIFNLIIIITDILLSLTLQLVR